jgi:hypothetical protein
MVGDQKPATPWGVTYRPVIILSSTLLPKISSVGYFVIIVGRALIIGVRCARAGLEQKDV